MAVYESTQTVNQSLELYFIKENLGKDGGLNAAWGKIKVWKFYIPIPNPKARRKALVFHDIHHIVTAYDGDWRGEVSIGAWEIASGCGEYWVAWYLNLGAMGVGLFIYPRSVFNAFIRGRRTENLYHHTISQEQAMQMQVGELQRKLKLNRELHPGVTIAEITSFLSWSAAALIVTFAPWILLVFILKWLTA
jgi:hypothetical protein